MESWSSGASNLFTRLEAGSRKCPSFLGILCTHLLCILLYFPHVLLVFGEKEYYPDGLYLSTQWDMTEGVPPHPCIILLSRQMLFSHYFNPYNEQTGPSLNGNGYWFTHHCHSTCSSNWVPLGVREANYPTLPLVVTVAIVFSYTLSPCNLIWEDLHACHTVNPQSNLVWRWICNKDFPPLVAVSAAARAVGLVLL